MKAAGIEPTNDVMKAVGNLAAANSTTIAQAASAITKANKGLTEELGSQLNIVSKVSADSVKLTVQGVETTVKRSGTNISDFLLDIGRTKFATGMEDQMQTIGGKLSNLSDATTNFKVLIGEAGLNKAVFNLVDQFIKWIAVNDKLAEQIGKKLGVAVDGLGKSIKTVQDNSGKAQVATGAFVGALAIPKVVAFGVEAKLALLGIGAALVKLKTKTIAFGAVLRTITLPMVGIAALALLIIDLILFFAGGPSLIGAFVDKFKDGEGGLAGMAGALLEMKDAVVKIVSALVDTLAPIIADIGKSVGEILGSLFGAIGSILQPVIEVVSIIVQFALQIVAVALQLAAILIKIVLGILKPVMKIAVFLLKAVAFIFKILGALVKGILRPIFNILKAIGSAVAVVFSDMIEAWTQIFGAITEMGARIFQPITDAFDRFIESVKNIIRKLPAKLVPNEVLTWAGVVKPALIGGGEGGQFAGAGRRIVAARGVNALLDQLDAAPTLGAAVAGFNMNGNVQVTINTDSSDPQAIADKAREGTREGMTDWSSEVANLTAVQ